MCGLGKSALQGAFVRDSFTEYCQYLLLFETVRLATATGECPGVLIYTSYIIPFAWPQQRLPLIVPSFFSCFRSIQSFGCPKSVLVHFSNRFCEDGLQTLAAPPLPPPPP